VRLDQVTPMPAILPDFRCGMAETVLVKVKAMTKEQAYRYGYKLGQTAGYNAGRYRSALDARRSLRQEVA